ncbi:MAG: tryptophan-rich sensory protein [Candidatus Pacebacteria bacterium]|nr:tryptophan-rich sensory protein [Candidatus Paceibacterota bacterium]
MESEYYISLIRPEWAPPFYLFSPVWTILYILIFFSFINVFFMFYKKEISFRIVLPFILNLVFNLIYTPIQFGLKSNVLAGIDVVLVFLTLIWAMVSIYRYRKWISYIQIPYLLWVSFATVLQLSIVYLNL